VNGDFVALAVGLLNGGVVGVLVGDEESGLDVAAVGVAPLASAEHFLVQLDVVVVDGIIEGDDNHLGNVTRGKIAWDLGSVLGTEAVWKDANSGVARRSAVGIIVDI